MTTQSDDWTVRGNVSIHRSGARLVFQGYPDSDDFQMTPEQFPSQASAADGARLFREGVEAYRQSLRDRSVSEPSPPISTPSPRAGHDVAVTVKRRRIAVPQGAR